MLRDESLQVTDESRVSTEGKASLEKLLLGDDVELVETHRLEASPIMFSELLEG